MQICSALQKQTTIALYIQSGSNSSEIRLIEFTKPFSEQKEHYFSLRKQNMAEILFSQQNDSLPKLNFTYSSKY